MKLGPITFDENTDYDQVEFLIKQRISELVAVECSCGCDDGSNMPMLRINKFMKAAAINKPDQTIRYHDNIQAAYYELRKLDC